MPQKSKAGCGKSTKDFFRSPGETGLQQRGKHAQKPAGKLGRQGAGTALRHGDGLGLGDNTIAALMTRGLAEITRLGVAMGAKRETFNGLSGVGDLIVTCTSNHSRNHRAGLLIGEGIPAEEAVRRVGTVEGYQCAKIAYDIAKKLNVSVPIIEQLCEVCYNGRSPIESVVKLMGRPSKAEEEVF